ncbi:MAG: MBL fold metallo-hydrolase [Xanthomonadales bacterium]|nr:MBL fold metallo-hydrolase [Xanthomonadales bacterium]
MSDTTIRYAFETRPQVGEIHDILPGLKWLRLPLPFQLDHINVWLLEDAHGWALVDTGLFDETTRAVWRRVLERQLQTVPLTRVLVTHLHPDHVGCAGWLSRKFSVDLWMSREEYLLCRVLVADTGKPAPPEGVRFYDAAGFGPENIDRYQELFGSFGRVVSALPEAYRQMSEGDSLHIGGREWRVIIGRGHCPEHACLYCPELNVLISGDQILPTISSNVSVYPTEPAANPLASWFESLRRLKRELPADVLVLPAHGKPFRGAHQRLDALIAEHEEGLRKLQKYCAEPRRAIDVFPALFKSRINDSNLIMATGESIAHLHYLIARGAMEVERDAGGVKWYRTVSSG